MKFTRFISFLSAVAIVVSSGCSKSPAADVSSKLERTDWAPDVKANVNEFLSLYRNTPNGYVVFDFDNTSSIFETMSFALTPDNFTASIFKIDCKIKKGENR